jgi:predicted RNA-binding protein with PUA-like domain
MPAATGIFFWCGGVAVKYWLMKSEPEVFGIDDLARQPHRRTSWDGVRNYQVRNMMRDEMRPGDQALFYHSSCAEPGVAGTVKIVSGGHPDASAFDRRSPYHDPGSTRAAPRWFAVDVQLQQRFDRVITLPELRAEKMLADLAILRRGNRLSVTPVTAAEWKYVLKLAG